MPEEKARKHLRMQGWDFTSPGGYFITISTRRMHAAFGTVVEGRMVLNDAGKIADAFWREIPLHFPHVLVDEHVVMPDHLHGLLLITACRDDMERVHSPTACRGGIETPWRGVLEIFPFPSSRAPNARRASWCNAYALALADRIVVGHLNPEGMLACILSEVDPEKDITQL